MNRLIRILLASSMLAALWHAGALSPAHAATFPEEAAWIPLTQGGIFIGDPLNDGQNNAREVVGDATSPAVAIANDGIDFFVRLRLDDDPTQGAGLRPYGWGVLIDIDGDLSDYEFSLIANGIPDIIEFAQNTMPTGLGDPSDGAETLLHSYPINLGAGGNTRVIAAGTSFNGTPDYFLDYAIPLADLYSTGITPTTPLIFIAGTSSNGRSLSVDIAATDQVPGPGTLPIAGSDPIYPDGESPGSACGDSIIRAPEDCDDGNSEAGDGCSDTCVAEPGYTCTGEPSVCTPDRDGDGVSNDMDSQPDDPLVCRDIDNDGCDDCSGGVGADPANDGTDTDGDGICNLADNCPEVPNPEQLDQNGDGLGDACSSDDNGDQDGDGVPDELDLDPQDPTVCTDADNDGCDDCSGGVGADPANDGPDTDGEGVCDVTDNCPEVPNPAQRDQDGDGVGDDCDSDRDGDGFYDVIGVSGGGCSASGTSGIGGAALVLIVAMLLALPLWRRRAAGVIASVGAVVAIASSAGTARAQIDENSSFQLERFRLSQGGEGILDVEGGTAVGHMSWDLGMWLGLSSNPLLTYREMDGTRERAGTLVSQRLGGTLMGWIGIKDWLQIGMDVPVILYQDRPDSTVISPMGLAPVASFGVGDARLVPKVQVLRQSEHGVALAVMAAFTLPSSTSDDYFGEASASFAPEIAISRNMGQYRLAGNAGYRARKNSSLVNLQIRDELFFRVGAGYQIMSGERPLELGLSLVTSMAAAAPLQNANQNHLESLVGLSYFFNPNVVGVAAAGLGLNQGFGTPDWRTVLGVRFHHGAARQEPILLAQVSVEEVEPVPPDTDGDGIIDSQDACVEQPGPSDNQGCPWGDADGDGITDNLDQCPDQAEDLDGFQDDDGCPDLDNDNDGVMDTADTCVNEPGPVENHGCPDTDKDRDTVVDRLDNCPDEPGTVANHGCKVKQLVQITGNKLDIVETVYFRTNRAEIQPVSFRLLDNVSQVLAAHPVIQVRIEGHTDDRGNDERNLKLSQDRADAVKAYLIKKGVDAARLEAIGYGESKPIADNKSRQGQAANRRVEFNIINAATDTEIRKDSSGPAGDTMDP